MLYHLSYNHCHVVLVADGFDLLVTPANDKPVLGLKPVPARRGASVANHPLLSLTLKMNFISIMGLELQEPK